MPKVLRTRELLALGIGGMIGGGIFSVLGLSIRFSGHAAFLSFMIGGLTAIFTGYSYAKLGLKYRSEGGSFIYIEKAFKNRHIGGFGGWILFIGYAGTLSLYAFTFGAYGAAMVGGAFHILASAIIVLFVLVNLLGVKEMGKVEDLIVYVKASILLALIAIGLALSNPERIHPVFDRGFSGVLIGSAIIFVAYEGFELINNAINDVENPEKVVPRGLYGSIIFVAVLYTVIAYVTVLNLDVNQIARYEDYALAVVAEPLLGEAGFLLVGFAALLSTSSAINATIFGTSRLAFVLSKYRELPKAFSFKEKAKDVPYVSIVVVGGAALLLANLGSLGLIASFSSASFLIIFFLVNLSAFKLRKEVGLNPALSLLGLLLCGGSLLVLLGHLYITAPTELLFIFLVMLLVLIFEVAFTERAKALHEIYEIYSKEVSSIRR